MGGGRRVPPPLTGHAFLERGYLIIPGLRSSRIYIVDTKPGPTQAKIHKIIEPEEVFKKTGYSRPHTVHCGPEGIYVSTLGGEGRDGTEGPPGVLRLHPRPLGDRSRSLRCP
jgi:methanethiol oxidase